MQLRIVKGVNDGKVFELEPGSNLIGRWDPDAASFPEVDLEEDDVEAKISRKHAVVYLDDDRVEVEDVGSLNGTFINRGERLEPGMRHPLLVGDELVIGAVGLRLEVP